MSTLQDIYAAGSENRPHMLNKENYVPWSSRLFRYAKSRPNRKLIHNSIINGPYVRRMIPELGDPNREVPVNETFHVQTDDKLTKKELKQIEADDQAIHTILLGLPEDIYAAVDSCETAKEIWLRVQQMMKGSDIGIQDKKAKLFNEWERFTSTEGESIQSYYHHFLKLMNDLKRNKHFPEKIASNLKFLNNLQPEWSRHVTIVHQTKDLHTTDYTPLYDFLKYNQKEVDELKAERRAKTQDPLALMATSNNPYTFPVTHQDQPSFNQNYMQQPMPNPEDIIDPTTAMNMALALMAKAFKLNYSTPTNNNKRISSNPRNRQIAQQGMNMSPDRQMQVVGDNGGNQFRQYVGQNVGNLNGYNDVQNARNRVIQNTVQNSRVQNVGNQNGLIGVPGNANHNLNGNGNLVAVRTEGNATRHNGNQIRLSYRLLKRKAGIQLQAKEFDLMAAAADLDEIEKVNANCILMANLQQASTSDTQTDKASVYDSDGSAEVHNYKDCYDNEIFNMFTQKEQYTELLEPIPESHQVPQNDNDVISKVTSVEQSGGTVEQHPANVEETLVLYDSLYHNLAIEVEKVKTVNRKLKETNAKQATELARFKNQEKCFEISQKNMTNLKDVIKNLNKQLSKEKSTVSFLLEEKKKLKSDFKIREDELLDKQIKLDKRIKELDNILVKTGQSIQTIHMLSPKPDLFYHTEHKMALGYQNPFYLKQAQQKQQSLYDGKVIFEKHDPPVVHDSKETLQLAQENENFPIVNQVDARVQNFEIQFLKEAAKFVGDFKSLAKEADESLVKHKALELEIERLLRAVVSQDIMTVVQNNYVGETLNLQTELERTKERFENCIIKKENEYAKLWNDWYKKCEECKFDKISYEKAYKDMQQKIERLQAQSGDLKGKGKDTSCVLDTLNPLSQKLENENMKLEFRVLNYAKENAHLKTTYKNLFDSISVINHFKTSREEKHVPNKVRASVRTKPITVLQPTVFTKKDVNSDSNGLCSTRIDNTKTRRPQPRSNTKNDRVPSASKSSCNKNKGVEVVEHHRNLLPSMNKKHMSFECNNVKLATQNVKSKVVCAICKQCLIFFNHDVCLLTYVNGKISRGKKQKVIQICLWCVDSGCFKHMTGNLKLLINFVWKFLGTVRFENDHVAAILGFGNLQWGNILITRVYFVEGLGHNLFSVGQFCNSNLVVAFRRNACFVRNLEGVDLLLGNRTTNLYTINLHDMTSASPICIMARASSTKSWLWHQRLSHLNFNTINDLTKNDLVTGLPKFKYHKEHLCSSCEQGISKRASHPPEPVPNSRQRLHLLHMDLYGLMRNASINVSYVRTPQQNRVVERRNQTLVEAARTMLIFFRASLFLWAEAIATACFTQNRSIIHRCFNKTPYELINGRKIDISFLHVFGALCYPKNDREDIGKLGAKGDIGFFIGYSADSCAYRIYNRRTKKIMETMNVSFDELSAMAFEQRSSKPRLQSMPSGQISSGLDLTYAPSTITTQQTTEGELDLLFEAMYDDYIGGQPSATSRSVLAAQAHQIF
nr:integrase, catalytic region, zinc finger, CCHC-type, peptidase aspartic, catalytic [Tanacetum cinerariifolium]